MEYDENVIAMMGAAPETIDAGWWFREAFETRDLRLFMSIVFPPEWAPVAARILESGAWMSEAPCPWAPRLSAISPTVRGTAADPRDMWVRSCLYRAHDCLHQLWGLPTPSPEFSRDDARARERAQMCGEVAVLALTEFVLARHLWDAHPDARRTLRTRDALAMMGGPLRGRSPEQVAARLHAILLGGERPDWLRDESRSFVDYYAPMLARDRRHVEHNWEVARAARWRPEGAPGARVGRSLDGPELTTWMVRDFHHLLDTSPDVDEILAAFNRDRRARVVLPRGWGALPEGERPHAACMVVRRADGRILLAARRESRDDLGLLGGHVEEGEHSLEAAVREAWEEACVIVDACAEVYRSGGVVTYEALAWRWKEHVGDCDVVWGTWDQACAGSFGEYNSRVRAAMGA